MQHARGDFGPININQIGFVVKDRDKSLKKFNSLVKPEGNIRFTEFKNSEIMLHGKKGFCNAKLVFIDTGDTQVEIIEPGEGESIYSEFIREKGEGVHHLASFVDDLEKESIRFSSLGINVLQSGEDDHAKYAYFDTEGMIGIILELVEIKK